jgi:hypothetical protein
MADRHSLPERQSSIAANAALIVIVAIFTGPALAFTSTASQIPCPDAPDATLEVPAEALVAKVVSHNIPVSDIISGEKFELASSESLLVPRAAAAVRNAFEETDSADSDVPDATLTNAVLTPPMAGTESKQDSDSDSDVGPQSDSGMNTKLPGISDDDSSRYKKQMYRRDI